MRAFARQRLCDMIAECKADTELLKNLCEDPKLCRNRLNDYCPGLDHRRERELLVAVVADQGAAEIYQAQNGQIDEASFRRLIRRIVDAHGFTDAGVAWAVESWMLALGLQIPEFVPSPENLASPVATQLGTPLANAAGAFDVFISYRRGAVPAEARAIRSALRERNIRAFMDLSDLGVGKFPQALLQHIAGTPNFILLLSPNSLDGCSNSRDWLRQEIVQALSSGRNIIQVVMDGFEYPEEDQLDPAIRELLDHSPRIRYSNELFEEIIEKIARLIENQKRNQQPEKKNLFVTPSEKIRMWRVAIAKRAVSLISYKWTALLTITAIAIAAALFLVPGLIEYVMPPSIDYSTFERSPNIFSGNGSVQSIAFSANGKSMATGEANSNVVLWDVQSSSSRVLKRHGGSVKALAFSPNGKILASGGDDDQVILWDAVTGDFKNISKKETDPVSSISFSPDGKTLASTDAKGHLYLWDTGTWKELLLPREDARGAFAFTPNGKTWAFSTADSTIILWDVKSASPQSLPLRRHSGAITSLAFSPDSKFLASGGEDNQLAIWNAVTGTHITSVRETGEVSSIAFSPDGRTLASTDRRGHIYFWETQKWPAMPDVAFKTSDATAFSFSPNGKIVALAVGNSVELWSK
jgi:WD40 repeat protein